MSRFSDLSDEMWSGRTDPRVFALTPDSEELIPGVVFIHAFANATLLRTSDGPVMVDVGGRAGPAEIFGAARRADPAPLAAAIYTHGHIDHTAGMALFLDEAAAKGWPRPRIVGHRDIAARFDRYLATAGYNGRINARQFSTGISWPTAHAYPEITYDDRLDFAVGGIGLELNHARGETDDHSWIWWPDRRVLWSGDLFIWTMPNAGNPQKAQRYAADWAVALRAMAAKGAELLIPGHGVPIFGAERVDQALSETAELLESLVEQTVGRMNAGDRLERIVREVRPPAHLLGRPYLRPTYDEPEFIVRNIWRLLGGWYDGTPSHLVPAGLAEIGAEIVALAGGIDGLLVRARSLVEEGRLALACHILDWAAAAAPGNRAVHEVRAEAYRRRARNSEALQTRGIYRAAAKESERLADPGDER